MTFLLSPAWRRAFVVAVFVFVGFDTARLAAQTPIQPYYARKLSDDFMGNEDFVFTVGLRKTSGIRIKFSGASQAVPFNNLSPTFGGDLNRTYADGYINSDLYGNPGNTSQSWSFNSDSQVDAAHGLIHYHLYGTLDDANVSQDASGGSYGSDIEVSKILLHPTKDFVIAMNGGFGIGPIYSSGNLTAKATLLQLEDGYSLNGITLGSLTSSRPYIASNTGPAIGSVLLTRTLTATPDAADMTTRWRVRGGTYNFRLGPGFHYRIFKHLSVSASGGVNATLVASKIELIDTFFPPLGAPRAVSSDMSKNQWMIGYYGEASATLWISERTGFFAQYSTQSGSTLTQHAYGRNVQLDLGTTSQTTLGLTYRF